MGKSWDRRGAQSNHEMNVRLYETAAKLRSAGQLDLIFSVLYDDVLEVETARRLSSLGAPLVNYHVDLVGQWYRVVETGKYFDLLACAHQDHWEGLKRSGIRPYYLPMASNPPLFEPAIEPPFDFHGVLYLGSPWKYRRAALSRLIQSGVTVHIRGNNWSNAKQEASNTHHWRKSLHDIACYAVPRLREEGAQGLWSSVRQRFRGCSEDENEEAEIPPETIRGQYRQEDLSKLVRGAAINLGFTHFLGRPGTLRERRQVRLREFEIPMAGGFLLTQDCAQLGSLYEIGQEIETWNDADELIEKAKHYLTLPYRRAEIAERGRQRALQSHTWEVRFRGLLRQLSLSPPSPKVN
jgi:hypothetical protein